ncbi:MAG: ATP-dependent sacrificial sulfur transferase LarE [Mangrovibacterium sp.]
MNRILPGTRDKYEALKAYIDRFDSVAVAFSGGVDSSLLGKTCFDVLGSRSLAITLASPLLPQKELEDARMTASRIGIRHIQIEQKKLDGRIRENSAERCYFCKNSIFRLIIEEAQKQGIDTVFDGSNADDCYDYRPGLKALKELRVGSPLQQVGLNKAEIRELSRIKGLNTSNKPAYACLASRIAYNEEITAEKLEQIEKAERFLHSLGFVELRVRKHGPIARLEIAPEEREKLFYTKKMNTIAKELKSFGFLYVCMELEGYASGSLNRQLDQPCQTKN